MTVIVLAAVALATGVLAMVAVGRSRATSLTIGVVGSLVVLAIALSMPPEESIELGNVGFVGTPLVRSLAVVWSASLALLGLLELAVGGRPTVVGPSLVGLAAAAVALATRDPASSVAALAAGAVTGIVVPGLSGWLEGTDRPHRLATTSQGVLAILGSGLLALAVIAWGASAVGPLGTAAAVGADESARFAAGLALLVMVTAVAIRSGLIPLHLWAARFMEGVSPLAIPAAFTWGSAAFVLITLDWSQVAVGPAAVGDVERLLIIVGALLSIVLGGLAAMVHDDIEHVLGYSILQDAGIAVLAFASLEPDVAAAARSWLVASATVKTAMAAWATVVRNQYGGHRLADLAGWARHSPALGIAFAVILAAAVGLPGMALFDARASLIGAAMPGLGGIVTIAIAAMPVIYLGRIALAGVERLSPAVAASPHGRLRWTYGRAAGWSGGRGMELARAIPAEVRANRLALMSIGVLGLAAMAIATSIGGAGG